MISQRGYMRQFIEENLPFFTIFLLLACNLLLNHILSTNELDSLAGAKQFADKTWIPKDWYLNQDIGYRFLYNVIFGNLARIMPLYAVSIFGRLITYFLFSVVIQSLVRAFKLNIFIVILFIFIFINNQSLVAREWMIKGLETKSFAYICALASITALLRKNYRHMFLFSGLAVSFHLLVGIYASFCLMISILIQYHHYKDDLLRILRNSYIFLVAAFPSILAVLRYIIETRHADTTLAGIIYVVYRVPHHTLPSSWSKLWQIQMGASILLFLIMFFLSRDSKYKLLSSYALGSSLIFSIGFIIYLSGGFHHLKYYWFRYADTMIPFISFFLLACLISDILNKIGNSEASGIFRKTHREIIKRYTRIVLFFISMIVVTGSISKLYDGINTIRKSTSPFYLDRLDKDLKESMLWIRANTPRDSLFLISPFIDSFYITAERAEFVSFKHSPQTDYNIIEWFNRIVLLNGGKRPGAGGFKMKEEVENSFYSLSKDEIDKLSLEYMINYYLDKNDSSLPFKKAFTNEKYVLYLLK